jgi:peptide chain release factor 1
MPISTLEHDRGVEMREDARGCGIGVVVGRDEDRLDRGDRALLGGGDPLLELAHLGTQSRLVADGARHAAEQRGNLRAGLDEAEDVVDEEEDVLALVAEVLGHRQTRQTDPQARARGLVHLPVDERDLLDHAGFLHLEPEVVPLTRALAHAREHGHAAVLLRDVVDQLLDENRLADSRAAEEADLAAPHERRDQVDDLDPGLEDLDLRREVAEAWRVAVDRPALHTVGWCFLLVDRLADHVPEPAEGLLADRHRDRAA